METVERERERKRESDFHTSEGKVTFMFNRTFFMCCKIHFVKPPRVAQLIQSGTFGTTRHRPRDDVLMTSALRGGGGSENLPILQMNSTSRLRKMQMKRGGGSKNQKFSWT